MSIAKDELSRIVQQQPDGRSALEIVQDLAVYAVLNRSPDSPGTAQAQRWRWFLDVVFGAVVALGIAEYSRTIREAWAQGSATFGLSLFVVFSVCSFVVYDIAIYHALATKFPYRITFVGFLRFYLDLIMAFMLYVLVVNAVQVSPDWVSIAAAISFWHLAAVAWHLAARYEHGVVGGEASAVLPHVVFIGVYWIVAALAGAIGEKAMDLQGTSLSTLILVTLCLTILAVSFYRWSQVIRKVL